MNIKNDRDLLKNGITWNMNSDLVLLFEIETKKVINFLPRRVTPIESRPGISTIAIGSLGFPAGNLENLPIFNEINWSILVQPDLSKKMPLSNFCFFICNVSADCQSFLDHIYTIDKMPVYHSKNLKININNFKEIQVSDHEGLIYNINSNCESREFKQTTFWGQIISLHESKLYIQAWKWEGYALEYQKNCNIGNIYNHSFFKGLDVSNLGKNCYFQLISDPNYKPKITFYEPVTL